MSSRQDLTRISKFVALTNLGNNSVSLEDGWVTYNPIALQANRTYLLYIRVQSANPDQILSRFKVIHSYPIPSAAIAARIPPVEVFYEPVIQYFEYRISPIAQPTGNCIFAVRRFSLYRDPNQLADATVQLATDPDNFF